MWLLFASILSTFLSFWLPWEARGLGFRVPGHHFGHLWPRVGPDFEKKSQHWEILAPIRVDLGEFFEVLWCFFLEKAAKWKQCVWTAPACTDRTLDLLKSDAFGRILRHFGHYSPCLAQILKNMAKILKSGTRFRKKLPTRVYSPTLFGQLFEALAVAAPKKCIKNVPWKNNRK